MKTNNSVWKWGSSDIMSFYFNFNFENKDEFRKLLLDNLAFGNNYSLLLRVEFNDGIYRMLGTQMAFTFDSTNYQEIDLLYDVIINKLKDFYEYYQVEHIDSIQILIVKIKLLPKLLLTNVNKINIHGKHGISIKDIRHKYNSKFLPLTVNSNYFGKLILGDDCFKYIDLINRQKSLLSKPLIKYEDYDSMYLCNNYILLNKHIKDNVFIREIYDSILGVFECKFIDTIYDDNHFERRRDKVAFVIEDSNVSSVSISNNLSIIKYSKSKYDSDALVANPFIGTFDVETYEDEDGYAKVYAAGFSIEGKDPIMFYLDNPSYNNVLIDCIDAMLSTEYDGYIFYVHNLNYDGVFLIHNLKLVNELKGYDYYKIKPLYKDSSLLKIEISIEKELSDRKQKVIGVRRKPRDIKITFIDSSNLLKGSLRNLCKSFGLDSGKGYFPYSFVKSNTLNYVGRTPEYHYWSDISMEDYNCLVRDNWSLKDECLSYLSSDLTSLLNIIKLFSQNITQKFDVQMVGSLTISRLSLNIFLKNYLGDSKLPIIKGNMYDELKNGYYGGVTEVYKPYGKNLYYYDVNSLYPYAALNPMCSNKYTYIELYKKEINIDELFGFFYCEIEASDNYLGLLPVRSLEGLIMPVGKWKGWYFSEELKFAKSQGYKIRVIRGYNFIREYNVFNEYVNYLYEIKSTTKNSVEKAVAKSLLNNLLGRFGLNIYKPITEIVTKDQLDLILSTRDCNSFKKITDNSYLVSYSPNISKSVCESYGYDYMKVLQEFKPTFDDEFNNEFKDVSLVISAAITSYARIYMSKIKLDILSKGGNIYYTDTDSIVTDIPLYDNLTGKGLGQFKLEFRIKEGYFISNKTYCLVLQEGSFNKDDNSIIKDNSLGKTEWIVVKAKGVINKSLTLKDFVDLYNGTNVKGIKRSAVRTLDKGSVVIKDDDLIINYNSYTKRVKVYNYKNKWINTKPLNINNSSNNLLSNDDDIKKKKKSILNKHPPFLNKSITKSVINLTIKSITTLLYAFIALIFVTLTGDIFDLNTNKVINIDYDTKSSVCETKIKDNYSRKYVFNKYTEFNRNKSFLQKCIENKNNKLISRERFIQNTYENIIQELISYNIVTETKFSDLNGVNKFVENYLINQIASGNLKITSYEFNKLMSSVNDISRSNPKLYSLICNENKFKIDPNIRYNKVSKKYLDNYTSWVIDPYSNKPPGDLVLKNRLSLMEEFEVMNNNYTHLVNEVEDIIKDINTKLCKSR